jgi:hypothetical protein
VHVSGKRTVWFSLHCPCNWFGVANRSAFNYYAGSNHYAASNDTSSDGGIGIANGSASHDYTSSDDGIGNTHGCAWHDDAQLSGNHFITDDAKHILRRAFDYLFSANAKLFDRSINVVFDAVDNLFGAGLLVTNLQLPDAFVLTFLQRPKVQQLWWFKMVWKTQRLRWLLEKPRSRVCLRLAHSFSVCGRPSCVRSVCML